MKWSLAGMTTCSMTTVTVWWQEKFKVHYLSLASTLLSSVYLAYHIPGSYKFTNSSLGIWSCSCSTW